MQNTEFRIQNSEGLPAGVATSLSYELLELLARKPAGARDSDLAVRFGARVSEAADELRRVGYAMEEVDGVLRLVTDVDVIDRARLQDALTTRAIGRVIACHVETESTNDLALQAARAGVPHGTAILAEHQTSGRGRAGRRWHSPPNTGLWLSVVLRDVTFEGVPSVLTLAAGVAVAKAVREVTGLTPELKWPNDVCLGSGKVAGILCESPGEGYAIVGIGMNVNQDAGEFPAELIDSATSLKKAAGRTFGRLEVLIAVLTELERTLDLNSAAIREEWMGFWSGQGESVHVRQGDATFKGVALDVGTDGALNVRTDAGVRMVHVGDVEYRTSAAYSNKSKP